MKTLEDEAFDELATRQGDWGSGFQTKPWNEEEWRKNNWRCSHGWLRGEQCEICNAPLPAQEPVAHLWESLEPKGKEREKELLITALSAIQMLTYYYRKEHGLDGAWDTPLVNGDAACKAIYNYFRCS